MWLLLLSFLLPSYSLGAGVSDFTPKAHYTLDELSGVRYDSTVGAYDLIDNNSTASAVGKLSNGADLNGSNMFLSRTETFFTNAFSVSGWFLADGDVINRTLFSYRPASGSVNLIQVEGSTSNVLRAMIFNSSGGALKDYKTTSALSSGLWYHIVVTWDGTNLRIYVNGAEQTPTKTTDNSGSLSATSRAFRIGAETATSNFWEGIIDEFTIFDTAITGTTVTALYNSGTPLSYISSATSTATSTTSTADMATTNFALAIIIVFLSIWFVAYIYNSITDKRKQLPI